MGCPITTAPTFGAGLADKTVCCCDCFGNRETGMLGFFFFEDGGLSELRDEFLAG